MGEIVRRFWKKGIRVIGWDWKEKNIRRKVYFIKHCYIL